MSKLPVRDIVNLTSVRRRVFAFAGLLVVIAASVATQAAEIIAITDENFSEVVPPGKEADAIIGDWVIRNSHIVAVVAHPIPGRKANMTVRGVGGALIDLTTRERGSDQLSCFYPAGGKFLFNQNTVEIRTDSVARPVVSINKGKKVALSVEGSTISKPDLTCRVTWHLNDDDYALRYTVQISNPSQRDRRVSAESMLRCDGDLFSKSVHEPTGCYIAEDEYFRQTYAVAFDSATLNADTARGVTLSRDEEQQLELKAGESLEFSGAIYCCEGRPSAIVWCENQKSKRAGEKQAGLVASSLRAQSGRGSVEHTVLTLSRGDQLLGNVHTDEKGRALLRLPPAEYTASIRSLGRPDRVHEFEVKPGRDHSSTITLPKPSMVRAEVTDRFGKPIAAKVQFVGKGKTATPDFGPTSAISAVKNLVYTANGRFTQELDPGEYLAIVSHGNEYDAAFLDISVESQRIVDLRVSLARTVDTTGWVSTEYHSHSSPSGDNVSHQTGRVLNLLAEHIEFAPCTEHNRIDTYTDDLLRLGATSQMATCTGMELTGGPLPINHQNAFPLLHYPMRQDGGGPQTDTDPVKQIERLAMWDNASEKVVQTNHPNLPQILGDRDLDGKPDDGFRGMLGWMDVIEIHPPQAIFEAPPADISPQEKSKNRIFAWMQLLNLGYRIPGVVNTDAHYNFHGSGWLRNYVVSSSDEPSEISVDEMVKATQRGNLTMTTGPFLEVGAFAGSARLDNKVAIPGEDLETSEPVQVWVRVQCANWFEVNRVQVFANGRPLPNANFTRATHPKLFSDDTVRFQHNIPLGKFEEDTHIIVATIGENLTLGQVMGPEQGKLPPVAVSNPIFVDLNGDGFTPNGDDLGVPMMVNR
ncbi:MAG TPA: hypothetical protein DDW52_08570 [Planctomycetaceae bacterium]|nr:hypothetical protein [Planctomycetaceae bacterium]